MFEDTDVDTTFHIPVSSVVKAAVEEAEKRKNTAPEATVKTIVSQPTPTVSVAQTTPVQTVPVSHFVPVQYSTEATYDDKKLYTELSAVSDEVLACRSKVLNNIF